MMMMMMMCPKENPEKASHANVCHARFGTVLGTRT